MERGQRRSWRASLLRYVVLRLRAVLGMSGTRARSPGRRLMAGRRGDCLLRRRDRGL